MKCEIDIITDRKKRWTIKEMLSKEGIEIKEWFVEFTNEKSILSFEVEKEEKEILKSLFEFLKQDETGSRIILPNGRRVNPTKEEFEHFYQLVCEYIVKE
ncbi:hypothetical protein [Hippea alviniae]|uniref:hypothetical protein n=1 Tax=Hippea alviniae TaxID=1279027 RepID=UPI0003B55CF1|nr:hypothetical protein [Hippea alviniae]